MAIIVHAFMNASDAVWKTLPEYLVEPASVAEAAARNVHVHLMVTIVLWVSEKSSPFRRRKPKHRVSILLTYGMAGVLLLAGDAEARKEHSPAVRTRGLKRSSTFRNYTHSEPRFRALLTEEDPELELRLR